MSSHRYAPEFKDEAVLQVLEHGYSISEVAERLGVSIYSLYKWVKAAMPDKTERYGEELIKAQSEILKLRRQVLRTVEERDILKKAARYFARRPK